jgi:hypothetical protein
VEQQDEIKRLRRASRRSEQFPEDARCAECGEADTRALIAGKSQCYRCDARARGQSPTEQHHLAGRRISTAGTLSVSANEHRILSDLQYDWPAETLNNRDKNPLTAIEAHLRGWIDLVKVAIERVFGAVLRPLVALNQDLIACHGPQWWDLPEFASFREAVPAWLLA